jgi:hypothetical protein
MEYEFPNINYTFKNGIFKNHIDHVIVNDIASLKVIECRIIEDKLNMSGQNPIRTSFLIDFNQDVYSSSQKENNFYRFSWKEDGFIDKYQQIIHEKLAQFVYKLDQNLSPEEKSKYIEQKLDEVKIILLQAARKAD